MLNKSFISSTSSKILFVLKKIFPEFPEFPENFFLFLHSIMYKKSLINRWGDEKTVEDIGNLLAANGLLILSEQYGDSQFNVSQYDWSGENDLEQYLLNVPNPSQVNNSQWFESIEPLLTSGCEFKTLINIAPNIPSPPLVLPSPPTTLPSSPPLILPSQPLNLPSPPQPLNLPSPPQPLNLPSPSQPPTSVSPSLSPSLFTPYISPHTSQDSTTRLKCMREKKRGRLSLKKKSNPNPIPSSWNDEEVCSSWLLKPLTIPSSPSPSPPYAQNIYTPSSPLYSDGESPNSIIICPSQSSINLIPDTPESKNDVLLDDSIQLIPEPIADLVLLDDSIQLIPEPITDLQSESQQESQPMQHAIDPNRLLTIAKLERVRSMMRLQEENYTRILFYLKNEEVACLNLLGM